MAHVRAFSIGRWVDEIKTITRPPSVVRPLYLARATPGCLARGSRPRTCWHQLGAVQGDIHMHASALLEGLCVRRPRTSNAKRRSIVHGWRPIHKTDFVCVAARTLHPRTRGRGASHARTDSLHELTQSRKRRTVCLSCKCRACQSTCMEALSCKCLAINVHGGLALPEAVGRPQRRVPAGKKKEGGAKSKSERGGFFLIPL